MLSTARRKSNKVLSSGAEAQLLARQRQGQGQVLVIYVAGGGRHSCVGEGSWGA